MGFRFLNSKSNLAWKTCSPYKLSRRSLVKGFELWLGKLSKLNSYNLSWFRKQPLIVHIDQSRFLNSRGFRSSLNWNSLVEESVDETFEWWKIFFNLYVVSVWCFDTGNNLISLSLISLGFILCSQGCESRSCIEFVMPVWLWLSLLCGDESISECCRLVVKMP